MSRYEDVVARVAMQSEAILRLGLVATRGWGTKGGVHKRLTLLLSTRKFHPKASTAQKHHAREILYSFSRRADVSNYIAM